MDSNAPARVRELDEGSRKTIKGKKNHNSACQKSKKEEKVRNRERGREEKERETERERDREREKQRIDKVNGKG